jgi:hypothetical protein
VIRAISLVPAIRVISLVPAIPAVSLVPAAPLAPGSATKVDHRRRRIIRIGLIDHRRRVSSKNERGDADTDVHLRASGRGCAKRESGKD